MPSEIRLCLPVADCHLAPLERELFYSIHALLETQQPSLGWFTISQLLDFITEHRLCILLEEVDYLRLDTLLRRLFRRSDSVGFSNFTLERWSRQHNGRQEYSYRFRKKLPPEVIRHDAAILHQRRRAQLEHTLASLC